MTDNEFGRAFTTMLILLIVMTFGLAFLGVFMAGDVDAKLDAERDQGIQEVVAARTAPVGEFTVGDAPALAVAAVEDVVLPGDEVYNSSCAACHGSGVAGAPKVGDAGAWTDRISQGIESLYDNAINGLQGSAGIMPAKGGNASLSDGSVQAAVDYMVEQSQ